MDDVSFRRWIATHAPQAKEVESDIFIQYIELGTIDPTTKADDDTTYVEVNYTGRTLDGTVFTTRSEATSKFVGGWNITTHWVSDYSSLHPYISTLNPAIRRGLREMSPGDSCRIYIPAKYATGFASNQINPGYAGERYFEAQSPSVPVYFDIRLKKIVKDPVKHEASLFEAYVTNSWGMSLADSLIKGAYMRKTVTFPLADTLAKGESTALDVTEFFLDDFIIKTTSDSIARVYKIWGEANTQNNTTTYGAQNISADTETEIEKRLLSKVIAKMRRGEEAEVVCLSELTAKGMQGEYLTRVGIPQILPFTPRKFKIRVHPKVEETEE